MVLPVLGRASSLLIKSLLHLLVVIKRGEHLIQLDFVRVRIDFAKDRDWVDLRFLASADLGKTLLVGGPSWEEFPTFIALIQDQSLVEVLPGSGPIFDILGSHRKEFLIIIVLELSDLHLITFELFSDESIVLLENDRIIVELTILRQQSVVHLVELFVIRDLRRVLLFFHLVQMAIVVQECLVETLLTVMVELDLLLLATFLSQSEVLKNLGSGNGLVLTARFLYMAHGHDFSHVLGDRVEERLVVRHIGSLDVGNLSDGLVRVDYRFILVTKTHRLLDLAHRAFAQISKRSLRPGVYLLLAFVLGDEAGLGHLLAIVFLWAHRVLGNAKTRFGRTCLLLLHNLGLAILAERKVLSTDDVLRVLSNLGLGLSSFQLGSLL